MFDQSRTEHIMPRGDHAVVDERRRLLSVAVANHVRRDPSHVTRALAWVEVQLGKPLELGRWLLEQWRGLLEGALASPQGLHALLAVLEDRSEYAMRLRQSSPFASVLSKPELMAILVVAAEAERHGSTNSTNLAESRSAAEEEQGDAPGLRVLHDAAFDRVVGLIESPPEPTAALRRLMADEDTTAPEALPPGVSGDPNAEERT